MAKKRDLHIIPGGRQQQMADAPDHSLEAEQAVVGGLMLDNSELRRVTPIVATKDFYRADHRLIFEAIRTLEAKGQPFDPVTLSEALEARGELEDAGGLAYLATLARDAFSTSNIDAYARIIRKHSLTRQRAAAWNLGEFDRIALLTDQMARLETGGHQPLFHMLEEEDTAAWFDTPPPPRRYLVADYLPADIEGMVSAPGGTGKGFITLSLALSVASGLPFMRQEVQEVGGVLMLQSEDDLDEINRRISRAVEAIKEDPFTDLQGLRQKLAKNLMARSVRGLDMRLVERDEAGNTRQTGAVDKIIAQAKEFKEVRGVPLKLIVLDPFASFFGLEENSNGDANLFITAIRRISAETGATVLFVHHSNKEGVRQGNLTQANSRGASALTDGVRWQLNLVTMSESEAEAYGIDEQEAGLYVKAKITKSNYTSPSGIQWLKRRPGGYLDPIDLEKPRDTEKEAKVQHLDHKIVDKVAHLVGYKKQMSKCGFAKTYCKELKVGQNTLITRVDALIDMGKLRLVDASKPTRNVPKVLALGTQEAGDLDSRMDSRMDSRLMVHDDSRKPPVNPKASNDGADGFTAGSIHENEPLTRKPATMRVSDSLDSPPLKGEVDHSESTIPHGGEQAPIEAEEVEPADLSRAVELAWNRASRNWSVTKGQEHLEHQATYGAFRQLLWVEDGDGGCWEDTEQKLWSTQAHKDGSPATLAEMVEWVKDTVLLNEAVLMRIEPRADYRCTEIDGEIVASPSDKEEVF